MAIDAKTLETERDALRETLKTTEAEQRKLEAQQKLLRQTEMRTKRKLEALETLIDVAGDETPASTDE